MTPEAIAHFKCGTWYDPAAFYRCNTEPDRTYEYSEEAREEQEKRRLEYLVRVDYCRGCGSEFHPGKSHTIWCPAERCQNLKRKMRLERERIRDRMRKGR